MAAAGVHSFLSRNGMPPSEDERDRLAARGIRVVIEPVVAVESTAGELTGLRLDNGEVVARQALAVASRPVARSAVLDQLGLAPLDHPMSIASSYPAAQPGGATTVPGLYLAGNVCDPMGNVVGAAAQGAMTAAVVNADLVTEDFDRAVALK